MTDPHWPADYVERVYAGILGKIIGVYMGRPFEGWTAERIQRELGELTYYVHERFGRPLVLTDDDISGTFAFLRALSEHHPGGQPSSAQIGATWLNQIVPGKTILWWGGIGNSTEHTAFHRLSSGVPAPDSGSARLNGRTVAEQIGAQIFIDGWGLVSPNRPAQAATLARAAAQVSHDGEAVHAAVLIAVMVSLAFSENDIHTLIERALTFIPEDSLVSQLVRDVQGWHRDHADWRDTFARIQQQYGYDRYGGNCHVIPNHAVVIMSVLYGADDFSTAMRIANMAGWDTDCNSSNVACLIAVKNGLDNLDAGPDWRGPVADRLYISSAQAGEAISDAVTETYTLVDLARRLAGLSGTPRPKQGARYHFELPGSLQGFEADDREVDSRGNGKVQNVLGYSALGHRSLALRFDGVAQGRVARFSTPTAKPLEMASPQWYELAACPLVYPGQTLEATITAGDDLSGAPTVRLFTEIHGPDDAPLRLYGAAAPLQSGVSCHLRFVIPPTDSAPVARIGLEVQAQTRASGQVYLDALTWTGAPDLDLSRPGGPGRMWYEAWMNGVDHFSTMFPEPLRISHERGLGLLAQGTLAWTDYTVSTTITSHLTRTCGVAVRVRGFERYYALLLSEGQASLIRRHDGRSEVLASCSLSWSFETPVPVTIQVQGHDVTATVNGETLHAVDEHWSGGGIGLVCEEGAMSADVIRIRPMTKRSAQHQRPALK